MFRYLAPAGNTISAYEIVRALMGMFKAKRQEEIFTRKLTTRLKIKHCFLTSSGTVALYLSLASLSKLLNKREVVFPAYTCPSVLAAVIRAGLKPVLCDLDNNTSTMNLDDLAAKITDDTLAVISVHLFGIKDNTVRINELTASRHIYHIDDAAQSFLLASSGNHEGIRRGNASDAQIISFGRGKPMTLLQGGALITDSDTIAEAVRETIHDVQHQDSIDTSVLVLKTVLYALCFHPRLYWTVRQMPFLKLGKTIFDLNFEIKRMNPFTCALGNIMLERLEQIIVVRCQKANLLSQGLSHFNEHVLAGSLNSGFLLRFPLLMEHNGQREHVLSRLKQCGIGATSMYEAPLHLFAATKKYFSGTRFPNAQSFSERILTLPLHEFVTVHDIGVMSAMINQCVTMNN